MIARDNETGSVLVEALVAILIVAGMSGLWFETLARSTGQQRELGDRQLAMLVARSQLATVGVETPLAPGETGGSDAGLAWRISVRPYPEAGDGIDQVMVTVARPGGGDLVQLQSLRIGR